MGISNDRTFSGYSAHGYFKADPDFCTVYGLGAYQVPFLVGTGSIIGCVLTYVVSSCKTLLMFIFTFLSVFAVAFAVCLIYPLLHLVEHYLRTAFRQQHYAQGRIVYKILGYVGSLDLLLTSSCHSFWSSRTLNFMRQWPGYLITDLPGIVFGVIWHELELNRETLLAELDFLHGSLSVRPVSNVLDSVGVFPLNQFGWAYYNTKSHSYEV